MVAAAPKRQYARKADIVRAMEAARAGGLAVAGLECRPDGTIILLPAITKKMDEQSAFEAWEAADRL
ncbi:MAG: hypothetical protein P1U62_13820 [Alteraurantiacibacter sp. bin_em_oilr2.035]|nr:hypothetical protein [Alteraurantiacibacter sp. bin_em_oilr2.035]